jgi:hypothetical protein
MRACTGNLPLANSELIKTYNMKLIIGVDVEERLELV